MEEQGIHEFVMFGCWNNLNQKKGKDVGCVKDVMSKLSEHVKINGIRKIVVAGDNYYPEKIEKEDGEKQKRVYKSRLREGFDLLPNNEDVTIDMIFGNHDLETNLLGENKIYIHKNKNEMGAETAAASSESEPEFEREQGDCKITKYEMGRVKDTNIKLHLCDVQKLNDNTLLLLLDTSIYAHDEYEKDGDGHNFLNCYNTFLRSSGEITDDITSLTDLKKFQEDKIMDLITSIGLEGITNMIIVGHHPIAGFKKKEKKGKVKIVEMDDIANDILPILNQLYEKCGNRVYTYLCADYHSYQKGTIVVQLENDSNMHIQQYIVGTGGTKLDDEIIIKGEQKDIDIYDVEKGKTYISGPIKYTLEDNRHECGFLSCEESRGEWNFRFESTTRPTSRKSKKRKRSISRRTGGSKRCKSRRRRGRTRKDRR
jgi:hypothetical protein